MAATSADNNGLQLSLNLGFDSATTTYATRSFQRNSGKYFQEDVGWDGPEHHLLRLLAQLAKNGDLLSAEWMASNPEAARHCHAAHRADIESFAARLACEPDNTPNYSTITNWATAKLQSGS